MGGMDRAQALAWKERWRLVREREIDELRAMTIEERLRQLDTMFVLARELGWDEALAAEEEEVRERWNRLYRLSGAPPPMPPAHPSGETRASSHDSSIMRE
jgi:hypothetical protein